MLFESGTVALVTGAGRGIGSAIARRLGAEGATVVVNWASSEAGAKQVVTAIEEAGGAAVAHRCDVSDEGQVRAMFREVKHHYGRIDVLVNNAGVTDDGFAMTLGMKRWHRVIEINLTSTFLCSREAMKLMAYKNGGSIVNVSSVSGIVGNAGQANYAASKGGVNSLTKTLAREGGSKGIRVNAVAPGLVDTDMSRQLDPRIVATAVDSIPLSRLGRSEEIAEVVCFLASPRASYVTGQILSVDGGLT